MEVKSIKRTTKSVDTHMCVPSNKNLKAWSAHTKIENKKKQNKNIKYTEARGQDDGRIMDRPAGQP
jgi:hypothetical protein